MNFRELFHAFRHPERESRCHELTDEERQEAVRRVEKLLAERLTAADLNRTTPPNQKFST
jgi:hypothetical protein|nr:hypothetical protein [Oxalobacteraceae bacterium]